MSKISLFGGTKKPRFKLSLTFYSTCYRENHKSASISRRSYINRNLINFSSYIFLCKEVVLNVSRCRCHPLEAFHRFAPLSLSFLTHLKPPTPSFSSDVESILLLTALRAPCCCCYLAISARLSNLSCRLWVGKLE